ncbi:HelD family protein [Haematomicrobium sanguinis]|uniref:HelD family protein n=1 Tax=Haematomicrobium sanguinis TaxID=479106 RepID=UPI000A471BA5|nr:UvrD-helicase domain-containing protein [Haematomicrobium sanguinis]
MDLQTSSPASAADRELESERTYVDGLYQRLDELREEKRAQLKEVNKQNLGGTYQNRSERDAFAAMYQDRLAQLNAVDDRLVFGRLDLDDGERRYIGRIGLSDEDMRQLMVDWRAPEAGTFYQATAFDTQGVRRRRHLILKRRQVLGLEDEVLDLTFADEAGETTVRGEGALLAALNAKRTGRMADIVGTIQAEQDKIIRAPLAGVHVVQGGPGTGKTAVALHRAAYLLYTHRDRLKSAGVLLVGPSSFFMEYIERVLPSLGETGVVMASVGQLYPGVNATAEDAPEVARIKGQALMAEVIARAVADRERIPEERQVLNVAGTKVLLTPTQIKRARDKARATGKPHNEARLTFVKILIKELTDEVIEELEASSGAGNSAERAYVAEDVRTSKDVRVALNLAWMPITPEKLVRDLFQKPHRLAAAAAGLLSEAEQALLQRPEDAPWTESDVPLLDEAAELLGDINAGMGKDQSEAERERKHAEENAEAAIENSNRFLAEQGLDGLVDVETLVAFNQQAESQISAADRAASDRTWAFGHIVVDEAQELSPMQWRLLMRRDPLKSFTVVGDIAQTSSPAGATSWAEALEPFVGERFTLDELTVNYRTPEQIMDAAVRVAEAAGVDVSPPQAVREGRWPVIVDQVPEVVPALLDAMDEEIAVLNGGLIAVIAAPERVVALHAALAKKYGSRVGHGAGGFGQDIVVLAPHDAKGLEFDGVVIVDPEELRDTGAGKVGSLYVAMTRPTQRLRIIASGKLPAGIL